MARQQKKTSAGAPIRGYEGWSISDMRKKLAKLGKQELEKLRKYEMSSRRRKGALDAIERAIEMVGGGRDGANKQQGRRRPTETRQPGLLTRATRKVAEMLSPPLDVDCEMLLERLSEFLEHERAGAKLYERAMVCVDREEQKEMIVEFLEQTREHERILEEVVRKLEGDPAEVSEAAELARTRGSGLLEAVEAGEGELAALNAMQCLMVAEWICHKNWSFLSQVARRATDEEIREVLREPVAKVEQEEDDHYRWCERQVEDLSLELVRELEEEEMMEDERPADERRARDGGEDEEGGHEAA